MLKRLELIGFKSFADKTRFDFSPGVTAVVGPNGSGKSNIVDAVKWILGEQSAKSLRGGEMADVIFNGSSTRKSLGMAEVTMTFDNSKHQIKFDGDEVQVTRRVYRDGQGEYLINGVVGRLKDIKEMFLGSGASQGAYSIIEQGRVDALLVASTKERRQIFEEASGISRFRSQKLETLRKLEHVDADLTRARDNLESLRKTIQTLSAQASKAQKYQEYHAKLKELRIAVGLHEYHELVQTLNHETGVLQNLQEAVRDATQKTETGEVRLHELDAELAEADLAWQREEKLLGEAQRNIVEFQAAMKAGRETSANLDEEQLKLGQQRAALTIRLRSLDAELAQISSAVSEARELVEAEQAKADATASALNVVTATIAELSRQAQQDRENQIEIVRRAGESRTATEMNRTQVERLRLSIDRNTKERDSLMAKALAIGQAIEDLSRTDADLQQRLTTAKTGLANLQQQQAEFRRQAEQLQPELDLLREQRSALNARLEVLTNLERSFDGIGSGVQAVLAKLPTPGVRGLVADLLNVPREIAPLVDLALGERAQQFVVDAEAMSRVLREFADLPGRVGFVPLMEPRSVADGNPPPLDSLTSLVRSDIPGLPRQLLGEVVLVDDMAAAEQLRSTNANLRILVRDGTLWETNGTISVGPARSELNLVSRKSELRELREKATAVEAQIELREQQQGQLRQQADALQAPMAGHDATIQTLSGEANELRLRIGDQQRTHDDLQAQNKLLTQESAISMRSLQEAEQAWQKAKHLAEVAELEAANLKQRLALSDEQLRLAEANRVIRQDESTTAQVALTSAKQRLTTLQLRSTEWEKEQKQRRAEFDQLGAVERALLTRISDSQLTTLRASDIVSHSYLQKEIHQQAVREWQERREAVRVQRDQLQEELKTLRGEWEVRTKSAYARESAMKDFVYRRDDIVKRIREDYQVELDTIAEVPPLTQPLEEMQEEIDAIKRKIQKLGNVNLEALEQLQKEEAEEKRISQQHDDLTKSEKNLLQIIEQINTESRKAFSETVNTIRTQFQELFRKLFGGGMADIVIEDPTDILESGIEITARPPGKELRSISLLSGGEKTMTAIALLLAIFKSKPSPFCLLDEVDAALDEANTARLADIINEFREKSQFIIVTHKKRTMAMADVLHGVTMQESGVSKQVATRIEDYPDDENPTPQSAA